MKWGIPVLSVDPANYNIKSITGQEISIAGEATIIIRVSQSQEYTLKFLVAQIMSQDDNDYAMSQDHIDCTMSQDPMDCAMSQDPTNCTIS